MYVSFEMNEKVNGFTIRDKNGLSRYTAENENIIIVFDTDAGTGRNYSKILWYTDKRNGRQYRGQRFLYKYVSTVQGFSNHLYMKYKDNNRTA